MGTGEAKGEMPDRPRADPGAADPNHPVDVSSATGFAGGSEPSDEELISRAARSDDHTALSELLDRHSRMVFSLGLRMLRDRGRSEELVQESFTRLWRSAQSFDRSRGSVKTLLMTIARRTAIDMHRRAEVRPELVDPEQGDAAREPEGEFDRILSQLEVRAAMERLSDKHRTVIAMQFDRDMTQSQVADELGIPLGTVKSRSRNALVALREIIEESADE